jgi:two-component system response regulator PilR (NtrC family)
VRERAEDERVDVNDGFNVRVHVERLERRLIRDALELHLWNKTQAAKALGLSYPTLLSKIRLLGLDRRRMRV